MNNNAMEIYAKQSHTQKMGVSESCLNETEQALGIKLTRQYRELFQLVNAPEFGEWLFYPIKDKSNLKKTFDDVVRNTEMARNEGLAEEFIVIAENGTGNLLCMKNGQPEIYHQDHEKRIPDMIYADLKTFIDHAEVFES